MSMPVGVSREECDLVSRTHAGSVFTPHRIKFRHTNTEVRPEIHGFIVKELGLADINAYYNLAESQKITGFMLVYEAASNCYILTFWT